MLPQIDAPAQSDLFEPAQLRRQAMGDATLMHEVLVMFRDHARALIAELDATGDLAAWRMAAHSLKGTARTVGAHVLAALAAEAERLAAGGVCPQGPDRTALLSQLARTAKLTESAINEFLPTL